MKHRNALLAMGITPNDLAPTNYGRLPDGVTLELLWELWDICIKFGILQGGDLIFRTQFLLLGIQQTEPPDAGLYFTILRITDAGITPQCVTRLSGSVVQIKWDQSLDPSAVTEHIQWVDDVALGRHLKDGNVRMVMVE